MTSPGQAATFRVGIQIQGADERSHDSGRQQSERRERLRKAEELHCELGMEFVCLVQRSQKGLHALGAPQVGADGVRGEAGTADQEHKTDSSTATAKAATTTTTTTTTTTPATVKERGTRVRIVVTATQLDEIDGAASLNQ